MRKFGLALVASLVSTMALAVEYNKYPSRVDNLPSGFAWEICKGKKEAMPNCVTDGDTLRINYQAYRIGNLDTPESTFRAKCDAEKALGEKAKQRTRELLTKAKTAAVRVYIDPLTKDVVRDKYGRILSDALIDGQLLSEKLKAEGLAFDYDGGKKRSWCN